MGVDVRDNENADEVLARIEGPLALGERRLSLFSVTSKDGEVEVSLMGQRLSLSLAGPT